MDDGLVGWFDREISGCHFADGRLKARFGKLLSQMGGSVGQSIPLVCQDWANTKVVATTLALLAPVLNIISKERPVAIYFEDSLSGDQDIVNLIIAMHRSFFNSIHTYAESALLKYCQDQQRSIPISTNKRIDRIIQSLGKELSPIACAKLEKKLSGLKAKQPSSQDIAGAALQHLDPERKTMWLDFWKGLRLVRNKVSHSDPKISDAVREQLSQAGFGTLVGEGTLTMNTKMYAQIVHYLCQMINEITALPSL